MGSTATPVQFFSMLHLQMLEHCNVPIWEVVSRSAIDEDGIFPKLPCAQRPRETHTLIIIIIAPPIERFPP